MKRNNILKNAIILCVITLISGSLLGVVYELTKEPIALQAEIKKEKALTAVSGSAEAYELMELKEVKEDSFKIKELYEAKSNNEVVGYTFIIASKGYGGTLETAVGINTEGQVIAISILSHAETPGLGAKITEEAFKGQFTEKAAQPFIITKTGAKNPQDIDAIGGATISSAAVTGSVNKAVSYYLQFLTDGAGYVEEEIIKTVFSDFDSYEPVVIEVERTSGANVLEVNKVFKNSELIGYEFLVATDEAYGGILETAIGINTEGIVVGIEIVSHSETPGLGSEIAEPAFKDQFKGKEAKPFVITKTGAKNPQDIDAISSATLSTKAVTNSVNKAVNYYLESFAKEAQ